jgi:steroid 5-alpha reductase family enzyme
MQLWPILCVWAAASAAMLLAWWLQVRTRNAGIVDVVWAACMSASALFYASVGNGSLLSRVTVAMLGGFWGFRLCMHILSRVLNEHEDGRYSYLREYWGDNQGKFFGFFQAQALLTALFSLPFYSVAHNSREGVSIWYALGLAAWLVSVTGETVADMQLARFRKNPANRGKVCRIGLWNYSRHPNYFFEWLHWFTYVFLSIGTPFPTWLLSLLGPILILVSLCWVTGIPYVEAQALRTRGGDYREYQRTTSALIPWFRKRT